MCCYKRTFLGVNLIRYMGLKVAFYASARDAINKRGVAADLGGVCRQLSGIA